MRSRNGGYGGTARSGVTLVELLATLGIVVLLTAIILPAVFAARQAARRSLCVNNLKNSAAALHQHHALRGAFPAAQPSNINVDGNIRSRHISPLVFALPHLDQSQVYDRLNLTGDVADFDNPAIATAVAAFRCPADGGQVDGGPLGDPGDCNYRANLGAGLYWLPPAGGAFEIFDGLPAGAFTDGTSHTVMLSERLVGDDDPSRLNIARDHWHTGLFTVLNRLPTRAELLDVCGRTPDGTPQHHSAGGGSWFRSGFPSTWYNHAAPPNAPFAGCSVNHSGFRDHINGGFVGASSLHGSGVQCAYADGSVVFVAESIDLTIWQAVGTRAGGETRHGF